MYRSSVETAIKEAVGFKFLLRGFEIAIRLHAENALFLSFLLANFVFSTWSSITTL